MISYEYPLNERIRTLLRLEDLYDKVRYLTSCTDSIEHHFALVSLFEILEVAGRADLKSDLLQEMERQKTILSALRNNPAIRADALEQVLQDIDHTSASLLNISGKIGQHIRENEWLMSIKQRTAIPGGVCEFDVPSYHYWLHQDVELRQQDLAEWLAPLLPIYDGLGIVLQLLRDSGNAVHLTARQGVFQQMLAGKVVQMLRITLSPDLPCIPEISANKYALNIRFTSLGGAQRPRVCEQDVEFQLMFCNL